MIKSIYLLKFTFILTGFTTLSAQLTENSGEIYIDQKLMKAEKKINSSFTSFEFVMQQNPSEKNADDIRYSEQTEWIVNETQYLNGWGLYPDSGSVRSDEIFGAEKASSQNILTNLEIVSTKKENEESAFKNFSVQRESISAAGDSTSEEAGMEEFRKAFARVLKEQEEKSESSRTSMLEIDRMVHDETRSKVGRDFFDQFYSKWQPPHDARNYALRIVEAPGPNPGTKVLVMVNQEEIVRIQLQPGDDRISEAGTYAVHKTVEYLNENADAQIIY